MKTKLLIYPVIITDVTDESGHYFTVDSPNIPGMHTDGDDLPTAVHSGIDAIATMLDGIATKDLPKVQDPRKWSLATNQFVTYITVDMGQWQLEKQRALKTKTVRRSITIPEYLDDLAKARKVNVSRIATKALAEALQ
ncbi:MAG: type II toxin-antitoxin system HicB family antitoxin [Lactobacillus sp.]|jgi:predicted RNase H-like HicB family nuclease|nr:type II toxin-antitoxin system HicB family antitoxin [Lactobacillus sp.]